MFATDPVVSSVTVVIQSLSVTQYGVYDVSWIEEFNVQEYSAQSGFRCQEALLDIIFKYWNIKIKTLENDYFKVKSLNQSYNDQTKYHRHLQHTPPTGKNNVHPSPQASITHPSPQASTTHPSPEAGTTHPSPQASITHPSPQASTTQPSPEAGTTQPSPQASTTHPSLEAGTTHPSPQASTTHP